MDFIQTSNKQLDKFGVGKHGFSAGNPTLGVLATYLSNVWCDSVQQELMNVIEAAGLAANPASLTQLLQAIKLNSAMVGIDTGAVNAAVVTYSPAVPALVDGMVLWFKAAATNTGASTLNVNGLGAKALVGGAHAALQGNEIVANGKCMVVYNATLDKFVLIDCTGAALQVGVATQSSHAATFGQVARLARVRVFTATGTFTPTSAAVKFIRVLVVAGGGGGGSGQGTGAGQCAAGGGGGGGGWARKLILTGFASVPMNIGAGGVSVAPPNAGNPGGTTSFGAFVSATGGAGGTFGGVASNSQPFPNGGSAGGVGSNGDENGTGQPGLYALYGPGTISGAGGSSYFGGGAQGVTTYATGLTGLNYGAGGGGGNVPPSNAGGASSGGGAAGVIMVEEYE